MQKKLTILFMLLLSNTSFAAFNGPSVQGVNTVKDALSSWDDTYVQITGNIVKSLGGEIYLFQDHTGQIKLEVDHDVWMGQNIGPNDTVTIFGEVDSEWGRVKIDVNRLQKSM